MVTIEYTKYGIATTDFQAEEMADAICEAYKDTEQDVTYRVGNEAVVQAMRLAVIEGLISSEDLQFKFKDRLLKINDLGEIENFPEGFCDISTNILFKLLKARK